jgi:hypothetical protein
MVTSVARLARPVRSDDREMIADRTVESHLLTVLRKGSHR